MFVKSRSDCHTLDWSRAEHYWYWCQWMEKASPCLCSHFTTLQHFKQFYCRQL